MLKRKILEGAWEYSAAYSDRENGTLKEVRQRDEHGRISYIGSAHRISKGVMFTSGPKTVLGMKYFSDGHLQTGYMQTDQGVEKTFTYRQEFDESGHLIASCLVGKPAEKCNESVSLQRYSSAGPLSDIGPFADIEYEYDGDLLVRKIIIGGARDWPRITRYANYKLDICGNWISRDIEEPEPLDSEPGSAVADSASKDPGGIIKYLEYTETREIKYYDNGKRCENP